MGAIRLLLFTGARRGEITGLRWEDVRSDRLCLPDSKTGPKTVWLNAPAVTVLATLQGNSTQGLVFPHEQCDRSINLAPEWLRERRSAAIPDVRLHDLRHSFASVAIAASIPLTTIGKLLGHALPETTARYAHLADDMIADSAERVCSGLARALGGQA
ncbi:site-specific integrase [Novosphingobium sp. BL-52-GroH]|uniref:site-specific integrase n=1 Tax=Novosphingobium sp. BL-52-GroH TaxID=3349877 RepID=UPI00384CB3A3